MSFKAGGGPPGMREISLKIAALARGIVPNVSEARAFLRVWPVCLQQFFRGGKKAVTVVLRQLQVVRGKHLCKMSLLLQVS